MILTIFFDINKYDGNLFTSGWSWLWMLSPIWGFALIIGLSIAMVKIFCYCRDNALMKLQQKESGIGKRTIKKQIKK